MVVSDDGITIEVLLSGWLSTYFDAPTMTVTTTAQLSDALRQLLEQVNQRANAPLPHGGMHILVNGVQAQRLVQAGYTLRAGDKITLVPVVAGGCEAQVTADCYGQE